MNTPAGRSSEKPPVLILDDEYEELSDLVCASARPTPGISLLWQELKRATLVPAGSAPEDVARLDSRVRFLDLDRGGRRIVRLVYPHEATSRSFEPVTSTIGAALIGLRPGDTFRWRSSDGAVRTVKLEGVDPPTRPRIRTPPPR